MEEEDIKEIYKLGIEFGFKAKKNIIKNWLKDYSKENIIKTIKLVTNKIENPVGFISYKLKNELDEEEEFIQLSSEEQAIAEFFSEKMPKVKRPKYETVPDWILKPNAIEIFSKYMSISEAEELWKEKGGELTRMINDKQKEMSTGLY